MKPPRHAPGAAMNARDWVASLQAAWRSRDVDAVAALFTADALYHPGPFVPPRRGTAAIRTHWLATLYRQADPRIWFGEPVQAGDRAAAEWWCVLHDPDTRTPRTVAGCIVLRFAPDGRCAQFHEYWHSVQDTALDPPAGWHS